MTLLTALRTAAVAAVGAKFLARESSNQLAMIGTGAQAEFMAHALKLVLPLQGIRYFDVDTRAMHKFAANMRGNGLRLIPSAGVYGAVEQADVVLTATADKRRAKLLRREQLPDGAHIHAIGGDCPGKTELDPALVDQCKRVVEYLPQTREEGEIQNLAEPGVHAELWELVRGDKPGRENDYEITLFDAVGFALEDFSTLRLIHALANEMCLGRELDLIPKLANPKDLFAWIASPNSERKISTTSRRVC